MPRYLLTERTLIGNDLVGPGEVEFDGLPTRIFTPLCAKGEAKRAEYENVEIERQRQNTLESGRIALQQLDPALVAAVRQVVRDEILAEQTARSAKQTRPKPTDLA